MGPVPRKLIPIFRDRHELAAAGDLSDEIEDAIGGIALPDRAVLARRRHVALDRQGDRLLQEAARRGPDPGRDRRRRALCQRRSRGARPRNASRAALRTHYDGRGRPTAQRAEPIAADLRETGDGRAMGLLKIVAGMLGVGLDDLAQREAQRRHRRHRLLTAASIAGMLGASGLAYTAIQARDEARDQRREAEGLVGFMLGDLRAKLEPVGRLDVLDAVGARALEYFEGQDKEDLGDAALAQRVRGADADGRDGAYARRPRRGAGALSRGDGGNRRSRAARARRPAAACSAMPRTSIWVGYIDYQRGRMDKAAAAFREYRRLADRMIALAPGDPEFRLERIYADSNLGTVLMDQRQLCGGGEPVRTVARADRGADCQGPRQPQLPDETDRDAGVAVRGARIYGPDRRGARASPAPARAPRPAVADQQERRADQARRTDRAPVAGPLVRRARPDRRSADPRAGRVGRARLADADRTVEHRMDAGRRACRFRPRGDRACRRPDRRRTGRGAVGLRRGVAARGARSQRVRVAQRAPAELPEERCAASRFAAAIPTRRCRWPGKRLRSRGPKSLRSRRPSAMHARK